MKFNGAKIITPLAEIEKMVLQECVRVGNQVIPPIAKIIESQLQSNIIGVFRSTPTYQSLVSGDLTGHFGLVNPQSKVDAIVDVLAKSITVSFVRLSLRGNRLHGGFRIEGIKADFIDILSMDDAFQPVDSGSFLQTRMPWLEWLLIEGDKVIVANYYFKPGSFSSSRTGMGIMVFDGSAYWKVPSQYSGTIHDNWITRTIDAYISFIGTIIENNVKKYL